MNYIPYGRQHIDSSDVKAVIKTTKNNLITTGPLVQKFETDLKNYLKAKYATVCTSGTAALHLAILSINLKHGDIFIVPSINFVSICNILNLHKGKIYLADVDPLTGQMTPENLASCIKKNKLKKIRGFVTMYLGGSSNNNVEFYKIKKKYKCLMIEDACHALGASYVYKKKIYKVGSCKHSDICVFSLHPLKSITTGEGGILTTSKKFISNGAHKMRSHGIIKTKKNKHWLYDVESIGLNYRLSDINCALGISQLKKIKKFIHKRLSIISKYTKEILINDQVSIADKFNKLSANHLFRLHINFKELKISKDKFFGIFLKNNVRLQQHYIPIYKFKIYKNLKTDNFKGAEKYFKNTISFPIYFDLTPQKQKKIINLINKTIYKY